MLCSSCGIMCAEGSRFCANCGARIVGQAGFADPAASFTREDGAATAPDGLYGDDWRAEKKILSVLFADIVGSTELIARSDPETSVQFLDSVIALFEREVVFFGGIVSRVMGDGIFALFGAPSAGEDHARDACLAALRIQEAARSASDFWRGRRLGAVTVRIGISTGEAIVRSQRLDKSIDHVATGLCAHLGARLQQAAEPGTIFCDGATYTQSKPENFAWRPRGPILFRSFTEEIDVYELEGRKGAAEALDPLRPANAPSFIGRAEEIRQAARFIEAERAGSARSVLIYGEPGIGKTRFCRELIREIGEDRRLVLRAECTSYGQHTPFGPFASLIQTHQSRLGASSTEDMLRAQPGISRTPGGPPAELLFGIQTVLGLKVEDEQWAALDATRRRAIVFEAVATLVSAIADHSGVLVIENVHWMDDESRQLLEHLLATGGENVIFILTSRHVGALERRDDWTDFRLGLEELARGDALALIGACLDEGGGADGDASVEAGSDGEMAAAVHARTGGNPLFVIQYVKELRKSVQTAGDDGAPRAADDSLLCLPATLRSLLAARIDAHDAPEKRMIQLCSVAGGELSRDLIQSCLADLPPVTLEKTIGTLTEEGFLFVNAERGQVFYRIAVNLLQEVVLSGLLSWQKRHLHLLILRAIETVHGSELSSNVETAAYHAKMSQSTDQAIKYSWAAGRRAIDRSAYLVATRFLEDALDFALKKGVDAEQAAEAIDICFDLRRAYFPIGRIKSDLENLENLEQTLSPHADMTRRAWLAAYIGRDHAQLGRPHRSLAACERARSLARGAGLRKLEVLTEGYIGAAHYASGGFGEAAASLDQAAGALGEFEASETLGLPAPAYLFFEAWRLWALSRMGDGEAGSAAAGRIAAYGRSHGKPLAEAVSLYSVGFFKLHVGPCDEAIALLSEGLEICEKRELVAWFTNLASALGCAMVRAGDHAGGRRHLEAAVARSRELGIMVSHSLEVAWLAEALLAAGAEKEALAAAGEALALAETYRERGNKAEALFMQAQALARTGAADAQACLRAAETLARECGMAPLLRRIEKHATETASIERT
ncbi:MAG: AAA family ATPase [Pseudomonadota bacterium]